VFEIELYLLGGREPIIDEKLFKFDIDGHFRVRHSAWLRSDRRLGQRASRKLKQDAK